MPYVRAKKFPGKDGKVHSYYQLVEGQRGVDGKVRQRVLVHLGKHDSIEAARAAATAWMDRATSTRPNRREGGRHLPSGPLAGQRVSGV